MSQRPLDQNYYEVLEVSASAPHHEIVSAYQRAKETYSSDSPALYTMFSKEEAAELRKLIDEAFAVLSNQNKRREYDQILSGKLFPAPERMKLPDLNPAHEAKSIPQPTGGPLIVPEGFARTRLSVYEVKTEVENEMVSQKIIDGPFLRKVRQYKNINLDQLSKETRISRSYLAAVESDDFEALPAAVFVRGFVAQVARVLGLNENTATQSYMSRFKKES
jgi:curved DNA-binding protein CbpA